MMAIGDRCAAEGLQSAPRQVVEVRQGAAPSAPGRVFPDLASALAAVVDPSAVKPWLVKVGPGVHAVPAGGLVLKPFVDLEGSGVGETVLEGAVATGVALWVQPLTADQPAVVRMAPNSRLSRLTVRNTSVTGGIAVYFPMTPNAGATEITAEAIGAMTPGGQHDYHAIRVEGPGADVILDRVTARYRMEVVPDVPLAGDNAAISVFSSGKLLVKNSRAVAENGWWNTGIVCQNGAECVVRDTTIEVGGRAEGSFAFGVHGARGEASNVRMTVNCPPNNTQGCAAVYACEGATATVRDSDLRIDVGAQTAISGMLLCEGTISSSRLTGPASYEGWKIVGCTDGESRPIPDRP